MRFCLSALSIIFSLFCSSGAAAEDMSSAFVFAQNMWREKVGVPPLTWSPELAGFARQWADHLKETNGCKMKHRGSGGNPSERRMNGQVTGENLSWRWSSRAPAHGYLLTPQEAVDMWGNEEVFYDHATGRCKGAYAAITRNWFGAIAKKSVVPLPPAASQRFGCAIICRRGITSVRNLIDR